MLLAMSIYLDKVYNRYICLEQDQYIWKLSIHCVKFGTLVWYSAYPRVSYSDTQSYANSFWGDVVLDSFNNVSKDEDNILDQIYTKKMCSDFYHEDLKFWEWLKKLHI